MKPKADGVLICPQCGLKAKKSEEDGRREMSSKKAGGLDASLKVMEGETAYRGLDVLTVYVQARRELLCERFAAFWREQEEAGTWDRLERTVTRRLHAIKDRRRAEERIENARRELAEAERKERAAAERARQAAAELAAAAGDDGEPPAPGLQTAV